MDLNRLKIDFDFEVNHHIMLREFKETGTLEKIQENNKKIAMVKKEIMAKAQGVLDALKTDSVKAINKADEEMFEAIHMLFNYQNVWVFHASVSAHALAEGDFSVLTDMIHSKYRSKIMSAKCDAATKKYLEWKRDLAAATKELAQLKEITN